MTRGHPEPPSIRDAAGTGNRTRALPGAPPYGAPLYGPDGTPLYPGMPPAGTPPPVPVPGTPVAPRAVFGVPPQPALPAPKVATPTGPAAPHHDRRIEGMT